MSKQTHYILQVWADMFAMKSDDPDRYVPTYDRDAAARLTIGEARRLYFRYRNYRENEYKGACRFPRIVKVTTEIKTITPPDKSRRRGGRTEAKA